mgnify:CR=1 FL=1
MPASIINFMLNVMNKFEMENIFINYLLEWSTYTSFIFTSEMKNLLSKRIPPCNLWNLNRPNVYERIKGITGNVGRHINLEISSVVWEHSSFVRMKFADGVNE